LVGEAMMVVNVRVELIEGSMHAVLRIAVPGSEVVFGKDADRAIERLQAVAARMDQDRRKWTQYLYGVDWGDASNYDIVLNLEFMDISEACQAVSALARQRCFEFTPGCQAAMDDLALASRVRAELALNDATSHLEVEVVAKEHAVRVIGPASNMREVDEVRHIVAAVPGVETVNLEELASPVRS
jgi:hypothetical protein